MLAVRSTRAALPVMLALAACVPATEGGVTLDRNWDDRYERGTAYYNSSDRAVSVFAEPTMATIIHVMPRGRGGFLDACVAAQPVCRISYGEEGAKGWVVMDRFSTVPDAA